MNISSNSVFVIGTDFKIKEDYWVILEIHSNEIIAKYEIKNETYKFYNISEIELLIKSQYN